MSQARGIGSTLLKNTYEAGYQGVVDRLSGIAPHISRYIEEFFGSVFSSPVLTSHQRELITIAALTAMGDCPGQLRWHINFSLESGVPAEEIVEAITHCIPFSGFPRALNALGVAKTVFAERGIDIKLEDELEHAGGAHERGIGKLEEIDGEHGVAVARSLGEIAPELANQIIQLTFGEIYSRPILDAKHRQLVTLASLTAQGGCEPQLRVHIHAGLRAGLTNQEVIEALLQCYPYTGFPKVLNAVSVAKTIFAEH